MDKNQEEIISNFEHFIPGYQELGRKFFEQHKDNVHENPTETSKQIEELENIEDL
ncbi:hypothetical protein ACFL56_03280 [Candidatus Margulisiibacteriota bacterium]